MTAAQRDVAVRIAGHLLTHPCELDPRNGATRCGHPRHHDDAEALRQVLSLAGLTEAPAPPMTDPVSITPVVVKRSAGRRCSACKQVKPIGEFYVGRAKCKSCHQENNSKGQASRRAKAPSRPRGRPAKPRTTPAHKECSRCKLPQPASNFNADSRTPDGLRSECRECHNKSRRARRKAVAV